MELDRRRILETVTAGITLSLAGCQESGGGLDGGDEELGEKVRKIEIVSQSPEADPTYYEEMNMIAESWRSELGLDVEVTALSFQKQIEKVFINRDYDVWKMGYGGAPFRLEPDFFTYTTLHSAQTDVGKYNLYHYNNPEFDKHAENQRQIYDREKRREEVYKCQRIAVREQPMTYTVSEALEGPYNKDRIKPDSIEASLGQGLDHFFNTINVEMKGENVLKNGNTEAVQSTNPLNLGRGIATQQTARRIYDRLMRRNLDGKPEPWAAKTVEQKDETTFVVELRDGMVFHDGEAVTAEDVKFSFEYQKEYGSVQSTYLQALESIDTPDNLTVQFNLSKPFSPFVGNGLALSFILPKHIWENIPDGVDADSPTGWANLEPVGSGPFVFEEWSRDEQMILSANEDHFNPPNIDKLYRVVGPAQSLFRSLEEKSIDAVPGGGQPDAMERIEKKDHINMNEASSHQFRANFYNCKRAPLDDVAFRRALGYTVPKQDILDTILKGHGRTVQSPVTEANEFWHNPDVEQITFDPETAKQILEDAGYGWDSDGKLHYPPGENPTEMETTTTE